MSKLNWTLDKSYKESIFENISIKEYTSIRKVKGFINKCIGIDYSTKKRYNEISKLYKNEYEQMKNYLKKFDKNKNVFNIKLYLSKHKYGRIQYEDYTSLSIFHRPTRHAYCNDIYVDIDIVNSMPSILYEICKINNYELIHIKNLENYVKNRDEQIKELSNYYNTDKEKIKKLFLIIIFGGKYETWIKDEDIDVMNIEKHIFLNNLEKELELLRDIVYYTNEDIRNIKLEKWNNIDKEKKGVFAIWYQTIERNIQESIISFLVKNKSLNLSEIIPCQDGFMILKKYYYKDLIEDCQNEIKNIYNIKISLKIKEFDERIEIKDYDGELLDNFDFLKTTTDFLSYIYECKEYKNKIYKQDDKIYFYYNDKIKIFEKVSSQEIRHIISKYILNLLRDNIYLLNDKLYKKYETKYGDEMSKILRDYKVDNSCYKIFNKLESFIPIKNNKVIYIGEKDCKIYNNSVIYINNTLFNDVNSKIYLKNEIIDRDENFKFNYFIDIEYKNNLNKNELEFTEKYFMDIFCNKKDTIKTVLDIMKTCIAGIQIKHLFCCLGEKGNNGKSVFFDIVFKSIMGNTMDVINKNLIIDTKIKSSLNTEFERLDKLKVGYVSEFKNSDTFSNSTIKAITGGDRITLRTINSIETTIKPTLNMFINSNELPQSAYNLDNAMFNRIVIIPFNNTFENNIYFKNKLYSNLSNIFSYIINNGNIIEGDLQISEEMSIAKKIYKDDSKKESFLADYLEEFTETSIGNKIIREDLFNNFYEWCDNNNFKIQKQSYGLFSKNLNKDYGIKNIKSNNINYYLDIKFKK
jgi:P4 family phage/plasmid primase-like protien